MTSYTTSSYEYVCTYIQIYEVMQDLVHHPDELPLLSLKRSGSIDSCLVAGSQASAHTSREDLRQMLTFLQLCVTATRLQRFQASLSCELLCRLPSMSDRPVVKSFNKTTSVETEVQRVLARAKDEGKLDEVLRVINASCAPVGDRDLDDYYDLASSCSSSSRVPCAPGPSGSAFPDGTADGICSVDEWTRTLCELPKIKSKRASYADLVTEARRAPDLPGEVHFAPPQIQLKSP